MKKKNELNIEYLPIAALKPYQNNAKRHPREQVEQIMQSIKDYGFNDPIAIDENGMIIEGHGRYEASKAMKLKKVPVIRLTGMTEEQKKEYILVHNKITMNSGFDMKKLKLELGGAAKFQI